jgi:integrase
MTSVIKLIKIDTSLLDDYSGKSRYFPGLVYKPTEQILMMATRYKSTHPNKGTTRRVLKVIQAFVNWYYGYIQNRENIDFTITHFERIANKDDIEAWMCDRLFRRLRNKARNPESPKAKRPKDRTIVSEGKDVARFLHWAKDELAKRDLPCAYEGGKKVKTMVHLSETNQFKGMKSAYEREWNDPELDLSYKVGDDEDVEVIARRKQMMGHEYLKDDELRIFFNMFYDGVYRFISLASYHTGMRPSEVLGIPMRAVYRHGQVFTCIPSELEGMMRDGKKEMTYKCYGKGMKLRFVRFNIKEWHAMMKAYHETLFRDRRKLWEKLNGEELSERYLWLTKPGGKKNPSPKIRFCPPGREGDWDTSTKPLINTVAKNRDKHNLEVQFGHGVDFYSLRHSFATNFLVRAINAERQLAKEKGLAAKETETIIRDLNLRAKLQRQLGHDDFSTTWDHYIHNVVEEGAIELPSVSEFINGDVY